MKSSTAEATPSMAPSAAAASTSAAQPLPPPAPSAPLTLLPNCNKLFVKVERLRRLCHSKEHVIEVTRGEDGTFGLNLSEYNVIVGFNHPKNQGPLRVGDQVRAVKDAPLVREKLPVLLERRFPGEATVPLHISRKWGEPLNHDGECFAALELRNEQGEALDEWVSELWDLRTDAVWGTFFTVPILPGSRVAFLGVHLSHFFTEPLLGGVEIELERLQRDTVETRWHSLRATFEPAEFRTGWPSLFSGWQQRSVAENNDIEGEVLLTVRKYASSVSVSLNAGQCDEDEESSDDEPTGPVAHTTEPLRPIEEPCYVHQGMKISVDDSKFG